MALPQGMMRAVAIGSLAVAGVAVGSIATNILDGPAVQRPTPAPVAHYSFDDGRGTDVSGNGNGARTSRAIPAFGKRRRGVLVAGSHSRIVAPHSASLAVETELTMSGWVYPLGHPPPATEEEDAATAALNRVAVERLVELGRDYARAEDPLNLSPVDARLLAHLRANFVLRRTRTDVPMDTASGLVQLARELGVSIDMTPSRACRSCVALDRGFQAEPRKPFRTPMPSVLIKPGSYGLDVDPGTGVPYAIVVVGGEPRRVSGTAPVEPFRWNHLAAVYDGVALRLYVNGARVGEERVSGRFFHLERSVLNAEAPLYVGEYPFDRGPSEGVIDEVKVYDVALTDAEVLRENERADAFASFPFTRGRVRDHSDYDHAAISLGGSPTCEASSLVGSRKGAVFSLGEDDGALAFSSWHETRVWSSATLDGSDDPERYAGSVTVQLWIKPHSLIGSLPRVLVSQDSILAAPFILRYWPNGAVEWLTRSNGAVLQVVSTKTLTEDAWTHVAGTYDENTGLASLYLDGELEGQAGFSSPRKIDIDWASAFFSGGSGAYSPHGSIDELELFKFARTADEVGKDARLHEEGCGGRIFPPAALLSGSVQDMESLIEQRTGSGGGGAPSGGDVGDPTLIDCRYAYCSPEQLEAWQSAQNAPPTSDTPASVVDCTVAICTEEQVQAWLARQQAQKSYAEQTVSPFVDCTVVRCDDVQWSVFQSRVFRSTQERVAGLTTPPEPGDEGCGPMMCCRMMASADDGSSQAAASDETGSDGSGGSGSGDDTGEDNTVDADDVVVDGGKINEDGTVSVEGARWADTGEPLDGDYAVEDEDGNKGTLSCSGGSCTLVPEGGGGGSTSGDGSGSATGSGSTGGGDDTTGSPGPGGPGTGGTSEIPSGESGGLDDASGGFGVTGTGFDPAADMNRSSWDNWGDESLSPKSPGESPYGEGRGRGVVGAGDVSGIIIGPEGMGTIDLTGSGAAYQNDHGWLVPVDGLENGLFTNGVIDGLLARGSMDPTGSLGSHPFGVPGIDGSPWDPTTHTGNGIRRQLNRGLGALSAAGPRDPRVEGLLGFLRTYLSPMLVDKPGWTPEEVARAQDAAGEFLDMTLGFVPFVGDGQDLSHVMTGENLVTGETLSTFEYGAALAGIVIGSGGFWKSVFGPAFDGVERWGRHFTDAELDEIAELAGEQVELAQRVSGDVKFRALTENQLGTGWGEYQVRVANDGVPIEYEFLLPYDVPYHKGMTVQVDGVRPSAAGGEKVDLIEAKYTNPSQNFDYSYHNAYGPNAPSEKLRFQTNQVHRYAQLSVSNPNVDRLVIRANTQQLADYYQGIVDTLGAAGYDVSKIVVELVP